MFIFCLTSAIQTLDKTDNGQLEEQLLKIAEGNKEYIGYLYEKTKNAVYGFALSILKNTHDAEDILQETYIRIFSCAGQYKSVGKPMAWILSIARNLSLMKLRDNKKIADMSDAEFEKLEVSDKTYDDKIILKKAMQILTDEERQIVMLHAVAGFKHREISELLSIRLSTVLSKYNRALKKLKESLKESDIYE